jgi:hypothetical protein
MSEKGRSGKKSKRVRENLSSVYKSHDVTFNFKSHLKNIARPVEFTNTATDIFSLPSGVEPIVENNDPKRYT